MAAIALVVFWLVFSLLRKMFGIAVLVALAIGLWVLWNDPGLLSTLTDAAGSLVGW